MHPIDVYIGQRVRTERRLAGQSQHELGASIGVRFQQIQKYETGANRISGSRLWEISRVLNVSVDKFFPAADGADPMPPSNLDVSDAKLILQIKALGLRERSALEAMVAALLETNGQVR